MSSRIGTQLFMTVLLTACGVASGQNTGQPWRSPQQAPQPRQASPAAHPQPSYGPQQGQPKQQGFRSNAGQSATPRPAQNPAALGPQQPAWWPLPPQHQRYLDEVLKAWERQGQRIEVFESMFGRRVYAPDQNGPQRGVVKLKFTDVGVLKYKKPDKGLYEILYDANNQQDRSRAEKWICDGDFVYQYDYANKVIEKQALPPNMRGKMLSDGPVPFVFGAKAEKMKQLYWIKPLPAPKGSNEIWLEIWPRNQQQAAQFHRAEVRLNATDMRPVGVRRFQRGQLVRDRNGKIHELGASYESFTFFKTVVNPNILTDILSGNPFKPRLESGWTMKESRQPTTLGGRQSTPNTR